MSPLYYPDHKHTAASAMQSLHVRAHESPVLYLLPAETAPRCEESGHGIRLMAFSFSLILPSVGGIDMICLGGSGSSFSRLGMLEADVPAKQSKGKIKDNQGK